MKFCSYIEDPFNTALFLVKIPGERSVCEGGKLQNKSEEKQPNCLYSVFYRKIFQLTINIMVQTDTILSSNCCQNERDFPGQLSPSHRVESWWLHILRAIFQVSPQFWDISLTNHFFHRDPSINHTVELSSRLLPDVDTSLEY